MRRQYSPVPQAILDPHNTRVVLAESVVAVARPSVWSLKTAGRSGSESDVELAMRRRQELSDARQEKRVQRSIESRKVL